MMSTTTSLVSPPPVQPLKVDSEKTATTAVALWKPFVLVSGGCLAGAGIVAAIYYKNILTIPGTTILTSLGGTGVIVSITGMIILYAPQSTEETLPEPVLQKPFVTRSPLPEEPKKVKDESDDEEDSSSKPDRAGPPKKETIPPWLSIPLPSTPVALGSSGGCSGVSKAPLKKPSSSGGVLPSPSSPPSTGGKRVPSASPSDSSQPGGLLGEPSASSSSSSSKPPRGGRGGRTSSGTSSRGRGTTRGADGSDFQSIPNLGATCYINAVLQCLHHNRIIFDDLWTGEQPRTPVHRALQIIMSKMNASKEVTRQDIEALINAMNKFKNEWLRENPIENILPGDFESLRPIQRQLLVIKEGSTDVKLSSNTAQDGLFFYNLLLWSCNCSEERGAPGSCIQILRDASALQSVGIGNTTYPILDTDAFIGAAQEEIFPYPNVEPPVRLMIQHDRSSFPYRIPAEFTVRQDSLTVEYKASTVVAYIPGHWQAFQRNKEGGYQQLSDSFISSPPITAEELQRVWLNPGVSKTSEGGWTRPIGDAGQNSAGIIIYTRVERAP